MNSHVSVPPIFLVSESKEETRKDKLYETQREEYGRRKLVLENETRKPNPKSSDRVARDSDCCLRRAPAHAGGEASGPWGMTGVSCPYPNSTDCICVMQDDINNNPVIVGQLNCTRWQSYGVFEWLWNANHFPAQGVPTRPAAMGGDGPVNRVMPGELITMHRSRIHRGQFVQLNDFMTHVRLEIFIRTQFYLGADPGFHDNLMTQFDCRTLGVGMAAVASNAGSVHPPTDGPRSGAGWSYGYKYYAWM